MTTDNKAVARWDFVEDWARYVQNNDGNYVLFTDHERVVGELSQSICNMAGEFARLRAELVAATEQQVGEVQVDEFDDAELQFYREKVGNLDGLLCMLGVMEITHDGDYTAAWKNTIEAVERLAARQQDQI